MIPEAKRGGCQTHEVKKILKPPMVVGKGKFSGLGGFGWMEHLQKDE
jgi:hypothetical protein